MKITSYILAFYIILLSAVPCCVPDSFPDDKNEIAATTEQHENGDDDCGNCSPFFSCEGCATATVAFETLPFNVPKVGILSVYTGYLQTSLPQVDYDFWHPPKLS